MSKAGEVRSTPEPQSASFACRPATTSVDMHQATLAAAIEAVCRKRADNVAVRSNGETLTYRELHTAIGILSARYRALGIQRGDRIICQLSNRPEHLVAAYAAWTIGAIHVGLHHQSTERELVTVAGLVDPALVVFEPRAGGDDPLGPIDRLRNDRPGTRVLFVTAPGESAGGITLASLRARENGAPVPDPAQAPAPSDAAAIFLTSGTTGQPKMPLGFHGRLRDSWSGLSLALGFSPDDVHLAHLPLAHGFGLMLATAGLLGGGQITLLDRFSSEEALDIIARERVTVFHGSATHFRLLLRRLDTSPHDVSSLRIGVASASAFTPALLRSMRDALKMELMVMYGSSEGVGVATRDPMDYLVGAVGRPAPGSLAIVGRDREPVPVGSEGEIAFSRSHFPVRYWTGQTDVAVEEVSSGWYYSGDLGRVDDAGRLFVIGRLKHQINRGGSKVDPLEVENAMLALPQVAEVAVIGVPHSVFGEAVCACVVTADGGSITLGELRAALAHSLAPFKLPEELVLLDQLPHTSLGKVDVTRLRAGAGDAVMATH